MGAKIWINSNQYDLDQYLLLRDRIEAQEERRPTSVCQTCGRTLISYSLDRDDYIINSTALRGTRAYLLHLIEECNNEHNQQFTMSIYAVDLDFLMQIKSHKDPIKVVIQHNRCLVRYDH